ncbi:MAG TPA: 30S ribosomal protein S6 [Candidatus Binatia bacterium]|nr:30S ribosomal protein S6 [Candidatus Binatia bacterium]
MRSYEVMIAYHPDTGDAGVKELLDRAKQVIGASGGELTQAVDWGVRDLAYHIAKQRRGIYYVIEFKGTGATVAELERNLRISDRVLRYITVQVDPDRPPLEPPRARRDAAAAEGEGAPEGAARDSENPTDETRDPESPEAL